MTAPGGPGRERDAFARFSLMVAGLATILLVIAAVLLQTAVEPADAAPLPQRLVPTLVAVAALCVAGLLARRAPVAVWLATASAAGIAAVEVLAVARVRLDEPTATDTATIVGGSALAGLAALGIALAYASLPRRALEPAAFRRAGIAFVGVMAVVGLAAAATALAAGAPSAVLTAGPFDLSPVRLMNRVLLGGTALGILVGLVRDVSGAAMRARARVRSGDATGGAPSPFLSELADELLPLRSRARRRAAEDERVRLAAELHATVLPELRRAAQLADRAGAPAEVATGLRRTLEEVERLMDERQSIVLEEFGLVAALEWLAERTEERTGLVVELELEGDRVADRDAVSPDVARAGFRVALLALDNVVRHADARRATIELSVTPDQLRLAVVDDGTAAWDPARSPRGRGLADMRRAAAGIGGTLQVAGAAAGTTVALAWDAPAIADRHAIGTVETIARRDSVAH